MKKKTVLEVWKNKKKKNNNLDQTFYHIYPKYLEIEYRSRSDASNAASDQGLHCL